MAHYHGEFIVCSDAMIAALQSVDIDSECEHDEDYDDETRLRCVKYYKIQSNQKLGLKQFDVPVFVDKSLHESWKIHLDTAIKAINEAAPGIHMMFVVEHTEPSRCIKVVEQKDQHNRCWTKGNIIIRDKPIINLGKQWPEAQKKGSALHELMHALGFGHEHQRNDSDEALSRFDETRQYKALVSASGLTRFDPHSVMMYPHDDRNPKLKRKTAGDNVWPTKADGKRCDVLSELDKVGLNIFYCPVPHAGYKPTTESSSVGLYYCGRSTFLDTEQDVVKKAFTDGVCGPKNGANCSACRVLKTKKADDIRKLGKWQGWTGLVYCGKKFGKQTPGHDGYCGPDNGPPCADCIELLL